MAKKHEDLIFKDITEYEKDVFLNRLGIKSNIKILNPTEIRFIDAQTLIADIIIELDDIILIIEFQSTEITNNHNNRFLAYYAVLNLKKKTKKKVKLVVVSTAEKSKKVIYEIDGSIKFCYTLYSMIEEDGDKIIESAEKKLMSDETFTTDELIDLSLVPLMGSKNTIEKQIEKSVNIIMKLNIIKENNIMNIISSVAYLLVDKFIENEEKKKVIGDALGDKMNAVYEYGQRRREEGIKEGKEEEREEMAMIMIKDGQNNNLIKKYTKLNDKKINQIRKELEN